jgi:DNA-binding GntR family transcriptional regulator
VTWCQYITDDLKARIESGRGFPDRLTLQAVVDHYKVSMTPVQAAVKKLIRDGYLRKGANARLAVNPTKLGNGKRTAEAPKPPEDPYERVIEDLVQLSLTGEPVLLREEETAKKYGISRSAMRHVFNRVTGQGLLEHLPRRGWRLRPLRQEHFDAFIEVRSVLELKALDLAWPRLEKDRLQHILDGNVVPALPGAKPKIDNSLHEYFIEKANNHFIRDFFERHGRYYGILFDWESLDRQAAIEEVKQHRAILEAILAGDRGGAAKALDFHIRNNHPVLTKIMHKRISNAGKRSPKTNGTGISTIGS